jgi:ATP-dependent DNA helicase RecG
LTNAASEGVKPPLTITTESVEAEGRRVLVVTIPEGKFKPYKDKDGLIFVKNGPDKRKVTSNEEIARLLQASGDFYAEEVVLSCTISDELDVREFRQFYEQKYQMTLDESDLPRLLSNLRLASGDRLNVAGGLLFSKHPSTQLFQRGLDFMKRALHRIQGDKGFNSLGELEIPEIVLTELLVNAIIHRDYFIRDSIRIFIFDDRIEIISPGKLPNNLTEAQIRAGIRRSRNTILASLAPDVLPYRGIGSGILRALKAWPNMEFVNDREAEQFTARVFRKPLT